MSHLFGSAIILCGQTLLNEITLIYTYAYKLSFMKLYDLYIFVTVVITKVKKNLSIHLYAKFITIGDVVAMIKGQEL